MRDRRVVMKRFVGSILLAGLSAFGCAHQAEAPKVASDARGAGSAVTAPVAKARPQGPAPLAPVAAKNDAAIFFDFDSSLVRADARPVLEKLETELKGGASVKVEGNCDETGTTEYNLALGEARARSAKEYLVRLGVPANRIAIASWGSQRPKYEGHDEAARAKNRRDDLLIR
jgi:peptidoglycan-associated lipoprotein